MFRRRLIAAASSAALLGGLGVATLVTAGAASATSTFTATTSLTNHPDGGHNLLGGGIWATDTLTRVATLTDHGAASTPGQELYSLHLSDTGTFVTSGHAGNPNGAQPADPTDATNGTVNGSGDFTFTVAQGVSPGTGGVPATMDGNPSTPSYEWPSLFFPKNTTITYVPPDGQEGVYSYTYSDSATCEQWVDSSTNGDGGLPGDGGISGDGMCKLTVGPVADQTATVGKAFSFQVPSSTGSSAGGIKYSFAGLNHDGLSGSASGLITGTPLTTDVLTVTATVTDAVGDNCPQNVEPQPMSELTAFRTAPPPEDDNGSCSVTFDINVVAAPAPTPSGTTPPPPTTTGGGTGVPSGGVQTGGGLPVNQGHTGLIVLLSLLGTYAAAGGIYAHSRARRVRQEH